MTDTNPSPDSGAEARIVVTTPEDVTAKALDSAAEQANALDLDATPSEQPEDPSESSAEENGEEPDEKKGKPPKGVQKRLDELTREKYDQQRRAEAAEARLEKALGLIEKGPQQQSPTFDPNGPPNPANYPEGELDINFFRDLAKYEVRQEIQAAKEEAVHQKNGERNRVPRGNCKVQICGLQRCCKSPELGSVTSKPRRIPDAGLA